MTASRAPRRGPSASPAPDIRALEHETRVPEQAPRTAQDHTARSHPTEATEPAIPTPPPPHGARPRSADPMLPASSEAPLPSGAAKSMGTASSAVRGAHLLRSSVPAHPSRVPGVRAMVAEYLTRLRLPPERVDDAVIAVGELFTNALRHGSPDRGDTVTVVVECDPRELRVSVADRSSALPAARTAGGTEESGRGLAIVAALTDDWGIAPADPGTTGKKVWFSMVLQGEP
ncbi:ATP-binding protein [Streptomyces sp. NPDC091209]|uniref:ATP-binding protein n=1 Tax=Streptomyces sp. NPDC091209 TaxID=3365974 RepID=UPI0037FC272D